MFFFKFTQIHIFRIGRFDDGRFSKYIFSTTWSAMKTIRARGKSYEFEKDMRDTAKWRIPCICHSCTMVCSDSDRSFRYRSRNVTLGTHENVAGHKNKRKPRNLPVFYGVDSKTIIFLRNVNPKFCFKRLVRRVFLSRPWILLFFLLTKSSCPCTLTKFFRSVSETTYAGQRFEEISKIASFTGLPDAGGLHEKSRTTRNRGRLEGINMFYVNDV